jgi:FeS assembly SUF system protein
MTDEIKNQPPDKSTDDSAPTAAPSKPENAGSPASTKSTETTPSQSGASESATVNPAEAGSGNSAVVSPESASGDPEALHAKVIQVLKGCYDPEIPVNIHELGLIYEVKVNPGDEIYIKMTLTSPMCPVAESLPPEIEGKVKGIPEVTKATVEVVWEPTWTPDKMSEAAKLQLGMV